MHGHGGSHSPPCGGVDKGGARGHSPPFVNLAQFFVLLPRVVHHRAEFITVLNFVSVSVKEYIS